MAAAGDPTLDLLLSNGLISLVQADAEMCISAVRGQAAIGFPVGAKLCDAVPVLFGLDEVVQALHARAGERLVMTNVATVEERGTYERQDFVVVPDPDSCGYLLAITPSLAHDELSIELEQNLRQKLHLETQVAAQARAISVVNDALKRTNADLVNFTRIISHDLKAPMRAIRYSAEDISSSLADADDGQQLIAVSELRQQSVRLSQMVTDLLAYSRLGDKSMAVAPIATAVLIEDIVRSLPRPQDLRIVVSGDWPEVTTVGVLLDVVLRNLIDNAVKHHDRGEGQISVRAQLTEEALLIVVSDDGPGIPEDYRQAVLRPFIKIKKDQHDSSGLGLSMVQKVINDVGGHLELGDRQDGKRGTRIAVSWPLTIMAT
jgi:signal transduction histidine kinase